MARIPNLRGVGSVPPRIAPTSEPPPNAERIAPNAAAPSGSRFASTGTPTPIGPVKAAPMLGEDTFSVLSDVLGYDEDQIAKLAAAEIFD